MRQVKDFPMAQHITGTWGELSELLLLVLYAQRSEPVWPVRRPAIGICKSPR